MQKQKIECRYSTFSTTSPNSSLRTLAPNVTQTTAITPPEDLSSYDFSGSLDTFNNAGLFLDDAATSSFPESSSNFSFSIPPLMHATSDGGSVDTTTPSLDTTEFSLWGFDPPSSDSASFMTGHTGLGPTVRPTAQTWGRDTTPRDQDHGGVAINLGADPPGTAARHGPEQMPERWHRTNWRIDREEEQVTDSGTTYDPLLADLESAMSRGKKDRHLQEQAATIMKRLMFRSQACSQPMSPSGEVHSDLEKQDVDLANLQIHEIIDGTYY